MEVLSTNRSNDKVRKFQKYAQFGVSEYWIIDPKSNSIDQFVLQNSGYTLIESYALLSDAELDTLSPHEKSEYLPSIRPTIFDDF